jgi:hypothetical protein
MVEGSFVPSVNEVQEFIEIAGDFANPLELVREAISNAFDAKAKHLAISFWVEKESGEDVLVISLEDDGIGMNDQTIRAFFDLGNSSNRGNTETIGEKGHGTKVYFNSSQVKVITVSAGETIAATMDQPYKQLFDRKLPEVRFTKTSTPGASAETRIQIKGYNNNRRERFTHEILQDYILWYTKFGSFERQAKIENNKDFRIHLKGLNRADAEEISFGHPFPQPSKSISDLFDQHLVEAPQHFCRRFYRHGQLPHHPEVSFDALFSIEGNKVKQSYNPMLRRSGYQAPAGAYTVQERYGLWLCKDFIPVQRANEWIGVKGTEYTRLHAFFNCQAFKLTANRGSVNNTPSEYIRDVEEVVRVIFDEITNSDEWRDMEWLESQAEAHRTTEREEKDFEYRLKRFQRSNLAEYKGLALVEPNHESGVYALVTILSTLNPQVFPFQLLDYNTHTGIDVIVKGDHNTPIHQSRLFYVEFKYFLGQSINHSFKNLQSIICWDTEVKHGDIVSDINGEVRRMNIISPTSEGDYTGYFLDNPKKTHKIEVFVLKDYLREKLGIEFRPRPASNLLSH